MTYSCSPCCLGYLPVVRRPEEALARGACFTTSMAPLIDAMQDIYSPQQIQLLKSRYLAIIDSAERDAIRSDWWDSRLFLLGFGGSLLVTIAAAISQAGYMTSSAITIVNTLVLLMSSIGTAAMGLRERLKFREAADISKRLSSALQQRGFLFMSCSGKFADMEPETRLKAFIMDVENYKLRADYEHQALRTQEDAHIGSIGVGNGGSSVHTGGSSNAGGAIAIPMTQMPSMRTMTTAPPSVSINLGEC